MFSVINTVLLIVLIVIVSRKKLYVEVKDGRSGSRSKIL